MTFILQWNTKENCLNVFFFKSHNVKCYFEPYWHCTVNSMEKNLHFSSKYLFLCVFHRWKKGWVNVINLKAYLYTHALCGLWFDRVYFPHVKMSTDFKSDELWMLLWGEFVPVVVINVWGNIMMSLHNVIHMLMIWCYDALIFIVFLGQTYHI